MGGYRGTLLNTRNRSGFYITTWDALGTWFLFQVKLKPPCDSARTYDVVCLQKPGSSEILVCVITYLQRERQFLLSLLWTLILNPDPRRPFTGHPRAGLEVVGGFTTAAIQSSWRLFQLGTTSKPLPTWEHPPRATRGSDRLWR